MSLSLVVDLRTGLLIPGLCNIRKSSYFRTSSSLNMAVRGFEPRYVAVYTLSGVLLQPLGHLTKLLFLSCWNGR